MSTCKKNYWNVTVKVESFDFKENTERPIVNDVYGGSIVIQLPNS